MTIMASSSSASSANQRDDAVTAAKIPQSESCHAIASTSLAAFATNHGDSFLSLRDQNQCKDNDSSVSTARTSCAGSSHDGRSDCGNDLRWEELSTGSGSDQDLDVWSPVSRSHTPPPVATSADHEETTRSPAVAVWSERQRIPTSHKLHHVAPPSGERHGNSWNEQRGSCARVKSFSTSAMAQPHHRQHRHQPQQPQMPSAQPHRYMAHPSPTCYPQMAMAPPHYHYPHMRRSSPASLPQQQHVDKGFFVGSPLQLTPVHLASLAARAAPLSTATPVCALAPRLRPVVHPINIGPPTEYDFRNTNGLMKCLNSIEQPATPEELSNKHLVINELQRVVDEWMRATFPDTQDGNTATLLLGGSWHLKVGICDSDLDIVVLLPHFVTAELFFSSLYGYLQSTTTITGIVAMNKAAVPILAFQLSGVRIDLLFARFPLAVVPQNLAVHSDHILAGMDSASIRSLSVPRVASLMLELVPNDSAFRSCLRIIRLWAKRRGVYSNKAGFLGGVSWTILVAFVCQMFPRATISSLVHRFFAVLSTWHWPTPIMLTKQYECSGIEGMASASALQWRPQKNHHDRAHAMPIITPGFPAVNSAVNVNKSTLRILQEEFERGKHILDDMQRKGLSSPAVWHKLFTPAEFLVRYDHYVVLDVRATSEHELTEWSSYVASRTRKLVETLQHTAQIQDVHPFPQLVKPHDATTTAAATDKSHGYYFIGYTLGSTPSSSSPSSSSSSSSSGLRDRRAATDDAMSASVATALRYFTATEIDKCPEKRDGMAVEIAHVKWQELPESVFSQGRAAAAGERARFILSRAHTSHITMGLGQAR